MKKIITVAILISGFCSAQTNAHLPLKSYSFEFVTINEKENADSLYKGVAQFYGIGEIHIYVDSISISWSNEWECGNYRLFVDSVSYIYDEYDGRSEWFSFYEVRSKGYHKVNGCLVLIEGTEIEEGRYSKIIFDTNYTEQDWARRRRVYFDLIEIN